MIAAWMLYGLVASLLLTLAAAVADRAAHALGGATRWVWAGAIIASLAVPAAAWWWRPPPPSATASVRALDVDALAAEALPSEAVDAPALDLLLARATLRVTPAAAWSALDAPLVALWTAGSLVLLLVLALAQRRLHRARREWRPALVHGAPVLVAGRTGPAVAGVWRPAVVLPEWALAADAALLGLMLAHEREHQRAGDPRLLALATLAVALMPWNAALWYQRRRLRLAVEIDCDRRVLHRHPDVARYGALLLEVGRRAVVAPALPLAALTSTPSSLERRIRIMTMRRPRHALAQGLALLGASALVATAALAMPRPAQPPVSSSSAVTAAGEATAYRDVTPEQVIAAIRQAIPQLLEEETGMVATIYFVVDAEGHVVQARFDRRPVAEQATAARAAADPSRPRAVATRKADHDMLGDIDPGAISAIDVLKFAPGRAIPDSADVVWVQLRGDAVSGDAPTAAGGSGGAAVDARTLRVDQARAARASAIVTGTTAGSTAAADTAGLYTVRGSAGTYTVRGTAGTYAVPGSPGTYTVRDSVRGTAGTYRLRDSADLSSARRSATDPELRRALAQGSATTGEPIYVIDGIIVQPGDREVLDYLPPESIDHVEVVKGAAAVARYGDDAAGGIVNITTKRGAASVGGSVGTAVGGGVVRASGGVRTTVGGGVAGVVRGGPGNAVGIARVERERAATAAALRQSEVRTVDGSYTQQPIYVIDGVVVEPDDPAVRDLAPERIESIEVVKGAAATALYGDRAAHGIIRITTKLPAPPPGR